MSFTTLISAQDLRALMQTDTALVVLDTSFDLVDTEAGERSYRQGRVPGAHFVHLERDLSAPKTGLNGRHPLPAREVFAATAGRLGVSPAAQVIVYDGQASMFAARAWWMLRWLGHKAVAVLDGGLAAWQAAGGPLETAPALPAALPPYPEREPLVGTIDAATLLTRLGQVKLIDARAPERFRGDVEPLDPQAGHIPGARNRFFKDNLAPDGRFKSPQELRTAFESELAITPGEPVIHQCGSGATACHNLLAMEIAGLAGSTLYPGSWSEWSADPARPIATG